MSEVDQAAVDQSEVAELRSRIRVLEDERAIGANMVSYSESLDYGDSQAWSQTFTPDGVFDVQRRGVPLFSHAGTTALAAFADTHSSAPAVYHKHFLSTPSISLAGDTATARTYFTMLHESERGPIVLVFGRYLDKLERTEAGWRFAHRVVDMEALPPSAE